MITSDREQIVRALTRETRTLQRQVLLKQLWRINQQGPKLPVTKKSAAADSSRRSPTFRFPLDRTDGDPTTNT
jgi:hypothetical protein